MTSYFYFRAGKPSVGLHLDVAKGDKLIQVHWANCIPLCVYKLEASYEGHHAICIDYCHIAAYRGKRQSNNNYCLFQKLMIDEKKCYLFGRNPQLNDFCIDHASCSRVHCSLVYHKHLNIAFLVDLGSSKCDVVYHCVCERNNGTS